MNEHDRWSRLKDLFARSLDQPEGERDAWLARQCPDAPELRDELLRLHQQRRTIAKIFSGDALGLLGNLLPSEHATDTMLDSRIGAYRLTRLLGEGGMGRVYLAERTDGQFSHQVALKLIRGEFATPELHQRFLRERDTLARLKHPNIAQLHDGGISDEGLPYFTLELIEGEPLTRWCDARQLDIAARLRLIVKVCDAVQYAHRNLIVHRDLKPSNILVTASGEPKLLDFGIAKPLVEDGSGAELTSTQATPMTREYAAPEQVLGEPITTATDVYSLGVILYLLLCGQTPYRRAALGQIGWTKAILEETPEPLNRAIERTHLDLGVDAPVNADAIAAARSVSARALKQSLRGDLERIIQRALAKSPDARYATVSAMAEDLRAFLDGRALSGGTRTYRLRKFVRRHWLPLAAACVVFLVVLSSALGLAWQSQRIAAEAKTTTAIKNFLVGLFRGADPQQTQGLEITASELVDLSAARIDKSMGDQPLLRGELENVLGEIYNNLGHFREGDGLEKRAIVDLKANGGNPILIASSAREQARAESELGEMDGARSLAEQASAELHKIDPLPVVELAMTLRTQAAIAISNHQFDKAAPFVDESLRFARMPGVPPDILADNLGFAALLAEGQRNPQLSGKLLREEVALRRSYAGDHDPSVAMNLGDIGELETDQGHPREAFDAYQQALALVATLRKTDVRTVTIKLYSVRSFAEFGKFAEAEQNLREVQDAMQSVPALDDIEAIPLLRHQLQLKFMEGKYVEAEAYARDELKAIETRYGKHQFPTDSVRFLLAFLHGLNGAFDESSRDLDQVEQHQKTARGAVSPNWLMMHATIDELRGDHAASEKHLREGLALEHSLHGDESLLFAQLQTALGATLTELSQHDDEAETLLRSGLALALQLYGNEQVPSTAFADFNLATFLARHADKHDEALRFARTANDGFVRFFGADNRRTRDSRALLDRLQATPPSVSTSSH